MRAGPPPLPPPRIPRRVPARKSNGADACARGYGAVTRAKLNPASVCMRTPPPPPLALALQALPPEGIHIEYFDEQDPDSDTAPEPTANPTGV